MPNIQEWIDQYPYSDLAIPPSLYEQVSWTDERPQARFLRLLKSLGEPATLGEAAKRLLGDRTLTEDDLITLLDHWATLLGALYQEAPTLEASLTKEAAEASFFQVGDRVRDTRTGAEGTVVYVDPVRTDDRAFLDVVWDRGDKSTIRTQRLRLIEPNRRYKKASKEPLLREAQAPEDVRQLVEDYLKEVQQTYPLDILSLDVIPLDQDKYDVLIHYEFYPEGENVSVEGYGWVRLFLDPNTLEWTVESNLTDKLEAQYSTLESQAKARPIRLKKPARPPARPIEPEEVEEPLQGGTTRDIPTIPWATPADADYTNAYEHVLSGSKSVRYLGKRVRAGTLEGSLVQRGDTLTIVWDTGETDLFEEIKKSIPLMIVEEVPLNEVFEEQPHQELEELEPLEIGSPDLSCDVDLGDIFS